MNQPTSVHNEDHDLEQCVLSNLHGYQRHPLRNINVSADRGTVTMQGTVGSFYERQLCIECCRRVTGVMKLIDRISVVDRHGE